MLDSVGAMCSHIHTGGTANSDCARFRNIQPRQHTTASISFIVRSTESFSKICISLRPVSDNNNKSHSSYASNSASGWHGWLVTFKLRRGSPNRLCACTMNATIRCLN